MSNGNHHSNELCVDEKCLFQTWKKHTHRSHEKNEKNVYANILQTIGNTPLVKLNKIPKEAGLKCDVYVKVEFFNPGGSIKDRMAVRMIEDAEDEGLLKPGSTIIEPTAGNTGIGLAVASAVKGYKCVIVMPERMSEEKEVTLKALGARIVRTPELPADNTNSFMGVAKRLNEEIPGSVMLAQFSNASNPLAHYDITGEELMRQCDGKLDMLVLGAGTGGTMTGLSFKLKQLCPTCEIVCVDPLGSNLAFPETLNETDVSSFEVEGIGSKKVWDTIDRRFVNRWIKIDDKTCFKMVRRLIREEGILAGGSSGSALAAALIAAKDLKEGQKCVVILPDGIRNYMTKVVSDNWMEARGFQEVENENNHWWWDHTVAELNVSKTAVIKPDTTCRDALKVLQTNGLSRVAVESSEGKFEGFLDLKHITKEIVRHNFQSPNRIERVIFKKFERVTKNTALGLLARILEIDEFVAVVDGNDNLIGTVTHLQLLSFVASDSIDKKLKSLKI